MPCRTIQPVFPRVGFCSTHGNARLASRPAISTMPIPIHMTATAEGSPDSKPANLVTSPSAGIPTKMTGHMDMTRAKTVDAPNRSFNDGNMTNVKNRPMTPMLESAMPISAG